MSLLSGGEARYVAGYYAAGDGGGGTFRYNAGSSATDNGGTIIAPTTGSGRWERVSAGETAANILTYGCVPADSGSATLNATRIQAALNSGMPVYVPPGNFYCNNTLTIPTNVHFYGAGKNLSTLTITDNTKHAMQGGAGSVDVVIEHLGFISGGGVNSTVKNAGYRTEQTTGEYRLKIDSCNFLSFYYGIQAGNSWYASIISNCVIYDCWISFYCDADGGSINNTLMNVYSMNPRWGGFWLQDCHRYLILNCNFGGHPTNTTSVYLECVNAKQIEVVNANFEAAIMHAWSSANVFEGASVIANTGSSVELRGCSFVLNSGVSATAYEVAVADASSVYINNCRQYSQGSNIRSVIVSGTAPKLQTRQYDFGFDPDYEASATTLQRIHYDDVMDQALDSAATGTVTLTSASPRVQRFTGTFTANRTINLPSAGLYKGDTFRIVRRQAGTPAAFTLAVGSIATIPVSQNGWVEVIWDGAAWQHAGSSQITF